MANMKILVGAAVLNILCLQSAGAATCNEQFYMNLVAHDNELDTISKKIHVRNEEKLAEKCSALALLVTRVVQSECQLSAVQLAQLGQRQRNLLANGMTSCWAARPYRPAVPSINPYSAASSSVPASNPYFGAFPSIPASNPYFAASPTAPATNPYFAASPNSASAKQHATSPAERDSAQAVGSRNIYENLNQCDMKVRNCYLQFQVNLMMRSGFRSQTCPIIDTYANCLLSPPACGFSEFFRPLIIKGAIAQTEFRYWESKECPLSTQKPPTTSSTGTASSIPKDITTQSAATAREHKSTPIPPVVYAPNECGRAKFRCSNGNCVSLSQICNAVDNCGDASDERGCQNGEKSLALQIEQIFVKNECYGVISNCTSLYVTPLLLQVQRGQQPDPDKLCKASNKVFQCALFDSCPLSSDDRTKVSTLLIKSFEQVVSRRTCQLITYNSKTTTSTSTKKIFNVTSVPNIDNKPSTTKSTVSKSTASTVNFPSTHKPTNPTSLPNTVSNVTNRCINSCRGIQSGNYHSCSSCHAFATCVEGILYDNRPCPADLVWDDNSKKCDVHSTTCHAPNECVSSCEGRASGDYQSCIGCDVYLTCHDGAMLDNRPCPAKLVWNDVTKRCEQYSPTCKPAGGKLESHNCVKSCKGLPAGQYQSCLGCSVYAVCENGVLTGNMPCPNFLVWDDTLKRCEASSTSCQNI